MSNVRFTSTKLAASGKAGILPPDENGYYTLPIGGLNAFNSAGQYYTLEGAKQLFEKSSVFMRRVGNGNLKGEVGHPKKLPGMSMDDYVHRILTIEETNVCCHFKEIWLDENYGKMNPQFKNPGLVAIMAKVKPSGPKGESLKASFENPDENVCFSIRALTRDFYDRGQTYRVLQQICTWDNVGEPGIANATKWASPSLESLSETAVTLNQLERIAQEQGTAISMESRELALESVQMLRSTQSIVTLPRIPLYNKW